MGGGSLGGQLKDKEGLSGAASTEPGLYALPRPRARHRAAEAVPKLLMNGQIAFSLLLSFRVLGEEGAVVRGRLQPRQI